MKIALVDDEELALGLIKGALNAVLDKENIPHDLSTFTTLDALDESLSKNPYDLLILDISVGSKNSIDYAKQLRNANNSTPILFISSHNDLVFEALKVFPLGFVRKSDIFTDLAYYIKKFIDHEDNLKGGESISVSYNDQTALVSIDEITYIEGSLKKQFVYLKGRDEHYIASSSMKALDEQLSNKGFIRVHSSFLVNYRYIKSIGVKELTMKDGTVIPVSRSQHLEAKDKYFELMKQDGILSF